MLDFGERSLLGLPNIQIEKRRRTAKAKVTGALSLALFANDGVRFFHSYATLSREENVGFSPTF